MKLLVAIHDVTPAHDSAVHRIWSYCASLGIPPAMLVVPNWHGEWPLEEYRIFVDWLRGCQAQGSEIFLHGERHDEHGCNRQFADEARAFGRTDREAEFLTLRYDESRQRIERGLRTLRQCGLSPLGFVAPAWLAHPDCGPAVRDSGLRISEDSSAIMLHQRGTRLSSPAVRWSTRTAWRASAGAAVARASTMLYSNSWLIRVALHPADVDHPPTWRSVRSTLDSWLARRRPWRYAAL